MSKETFVDRLTDEVLDDIGITNPVHRKMYASLARAYIAHTVDTGRNPLK